MKLRLGKFNLEVTRSAPDSPIQAWLRGAEGVFPSETCLLASPYQQSVWVYSVVSALAQAVSTIPFRISEGDRSGETIVNKGPIIDLFNRPHRYMNRARFWEFIVTWHCLRGEAFIVALDKTGNVLPVQSNLAGSKAPSSLLVLNPDQFRHVVDGFELVGW